MLCRCDSSFFLWAARVLLDVLMLSMLELLVLVLFSIDPWGKEVHGCNLLDGWFFPLKSSCLTVCPTSIVNLGILVDPHSLLELITMSALLFSIITDSAVSLAKGVANVLSSWMVKTGSLGRLGW